MILRPITENSIFPQNEAVIRFCQWNPRPAIIPYKVMYGSSSGIDGIIFIVGEVTSNWEIYNSPFRN